MQTRCSCAYEEGRGKGAARYVAIHGDVLCFVWCAQQVMLGFFLAMILVPYKQLRRAASSFPSALRDVGDRIEWSVQLLRGAPRNKRINAVIKLLLVTPKGPQRGRLLTKLRSKMAMSVKSVKGKGHVALRDHAHCSTSELGHHPETVWHAIS